MVILYRDEQINTISNNLNIPKVLVKQVITSYIDYLSKMIDEGKPVKFLNICNIRVNGKIDETHETLAYIATELSREINQSSVVVKRILSNFEESIVYDLRHGFSYTIRGLIHLKMEGNTVNCRKSSKYQGQDVRVMMLGGFKRKVEGTNA